MPRPRLRHLVTAAVTAGATGAAAVVWAASRSRHGRAHLERFDPPAGLPPGRVVAVAGHGELFVREAPGPSPEAPTVVLLHGWMFPADLNWFTSYGPLAEIARVIAPDHRGHGRGTRPSMPFRLADVADDVAALLAQLSTGPVIAVGYSMGGPIAQLLWQRHPEVVRGLVLCATAGHWRFKVWHKAAWKTMGGLQVVLRLLPRAWFEGLLHAQLTGRLPVRVSQALTEESAHFADLLPWVVGELERGDPEDVAEAGRELSRYDARPWLHTIDVPTAVLVTTRDRLVPPDAQRALAASIPGAEAFEVALDHDAPGAGPELFTQTLRKAVERVLG